MIQLGHNFWKRIFGLLSSLGKSIVVSFRHNMLPIFKLYNSMGFPAVYSPQSNIIKIKNVSITSQLQCYLLYPASTQFLIRFLLWLTYIFFLHESTYITRTLWLLLFSVMSVGLCLGYGIYWYSILFIVQCYSIAWMCTRLLSIHLMMGFWMVHNLGLLWIMLQGHSCISVCGSIKQYKVLMLVCI